MVGPSPSPVRPTTLGRWTLERPLGEGGMAAVWLARDADGATAAIKVLTGSDEKLAAALDAEIKVVASLDHPHVVALYDCGVVPEGTEGLEAGCPWLAMERLTIDIGKLVGDLDFPTLAGLLGQLLQALAHAHARGVVHRDIKPNNVLLADDWSVRLVDFGIAWVQADGRSMVHGGTPYYAAPEQFLAEPERMGPWTDLYALGCLAWRLACGRPPFRERDWDEARAAHLSRALPPFLPSFPVPEGFEAWLHKALAKRPSDRYRFAADMARDLAALPGAEGPSQGVPTRRAPATLATLPLRAPPLVGREREQAQLWEALQEAMKGGHAPVVLLRGPAGAGMGRLAAWVSERAHQEGLAWSLRGRHREDGPLGHGLADVVERHHRVAGVPPTALWRTLQRAVQRDGGSDADADLALSVLRPGCTSAQERFAALGALVGRLAEERGVVVVLEDVQWGADAVRFVRSQRHQKRVLWVLTVQEDALVGRGEEQGLLKGIDDVSVRLQPLPDDPMSDLVRGLLPLNPGSVRQVVRRAGGNPSMAVAIVRHAAQARSLHDSPDGYDLVGEATLPDDLVGLWRARVDAMLAEQPAWREPLELAARLGMDVEDGLWGRTCHAAGVEAPVWLPRMMVAEGLAEVDPVDPGRRWRFAHALVREAALSGATGRAVRQHRVCAGVMDDPSARARHLLGAEAWSEALPDLHEASRQAARAGALGDLERWVGDWATALEHAPDERSRAEWLVQRAVLAKHRGRRDEQDTLAAAVLEVACRHGWRDLELEAILLEIDRLCATPGRLSDAMPYAMRAVRLTDGAGDPRARARACHHAGAVHLRVPDLAGAIPLLQEAAACYASAQAWTGAAGVRLELGFALHEAGQSDAAGVQQAAALQLAGRTSSRFLPAVCNELAGAIAAHRHDLQAAAHHYREATLGFERIGHHRGRYTRLNQHLIQVRRGQLDIARTALTTMLARADEHLAVGVHAGLLVCAAGRLAFDQHLEPIQAWHDQGMAQRTVVEMLRLAATAAEAADAPDQAARARALADAQDARLA